MMGRGRGWIARSQVPNSETRTRPCMHDAQRVDRETEEGLGVAIVGDAVGMSHSIAGAVMLVQEAEGSAGRGQGRRVRH